MRSAEMFKYIIDLSWFFQKFLTTRNKLARAARKFFEYIIVSHDVKKEILNKLARAARENFQIYHWFVTISLNKFFV